MQNRGLAFSLDAAARNPLAPGRRPFHTLNPPLAVFDDGRVVSYGSMGGDAQPQFQAQVFTRWRAGAPPGEAIAAPRHAFGRAWGAPSAALRIEASYDGAIADGLARMGHQIERLPADRRDDFGHAGALVRFPRGDILGAHDPRSDGGAAGL
jgi:gamma-glutamyltranspeptidase/glutathione hydrolase